MSAARGSGLLRTSSIATRWGAMVVAGAVALSLIPLGAPAASAASHPVVSAPAVPAASKSVSPVGQTQLPLWANVPSPFAAASKTPVVSAPVVAASTTPVVSTPVVAASTTPLVAPDVPSAQSTARLRGQRVEALSKRTMDSTTWVNPNGSLTTDSYGAPVRVKDAKGKDGWTDVDLTLVARSDGTVGPRVHPQGLSMAGATGAGGTSTLASLGATSGEGVSLGWTKGLPKRC